MKQLASITKDSVQLLIDSGILSGWEDDRICFPCPYSDDDAHFMINFDTSEESLDALCFLNQVRKTSTEAIKNQLDNMGRQVVCRDYVRWLENMVALLCKVNDDKTTLVPDIVKDSIEKIAKEAAVNNSSFISEQQIKAFTRNLIDSDENRKNKW